MPYETGKREPDFETLESIADYFNVDMNFLLGRAYNLIPYERGRRLPILGSIPAGSPTMATENIEGYDYADVPEGEEYFFLRVQGDSMINAGISQGDLVLIKMQSCAENGQIVVCIVNGDEAVLKRFFRRDDTIILQPENANYSPILLSCKEFESGYARILGIAKKVIRNL